MLFLLRVPGRHLHLKPLVCSNCSVAIISRYCPETDTFEIIKAGPVLEKINCVECNKDIDIMIDTRPHSKIIITCDACNTKLSIKRLVDGTLRTALPNTHGNNEGLTDAFLNQVKACLPEQPWPKHIHKAVAGELGVSDSSIKRAITELIRTGECKEQINGKLYELKEVH